MLRARTANDTTRAQINNIPSKSHVIPLITAPFVCNCMQTSLMEMTHYPRLCGETADNVIRAIREIKQQRRQRQRKQHLKKNVWEVVIIALKFFLASPSCC